MANVFLNDLKLQKVWDAIRKNFYPVPPESGTAQPPTPAMEGDITIDFGRYTSGQYQGYLNSIVSTIGDGKVTTSKLADSAVTKAKLAAGAIDPVVTWGNGTIDGPTITIQAGKDTSVPKAVPAATAEYSGVITTTTQMISGDKTFKGNILGEQNIEALFGVSAHGHADLSIAAGGGAGTVTCISVNDAVKEPDGTGMITLDDYPTLTAYNTDKTQINSAISQINSKIPIAATASNQLADKEFVNSSINTATATFRGTYTAASDTEAAAQTALAGITTKDLNDYAFVKVENTPQTGVDKYKRYKYNGNNWVYEYTLNNSSFTASQWDAINSTITSAKVVAFNAKYDKPTTGIPATDLDEQSQTLLVLASTALQRVDFFNLGDHDTPVYFDAHGYGQVINALNVPGNIESTAGGVAAHGHADLGVSAGGGSGTTTAVRIGNGSPIEAVDGVVTIPTTQISQQPDGTIALGGVAIAVKGLGSFAYRSSINLSEVIGATDVVSSLTSAIGEVHTMAEDNAENIGLHDGRITDLESYFDGSSAKYALNADKVDGHHYSELVTALGVNGKTITWSKGGTAQTAITVPYAKQSTALETEPLTNQEFIFRNSPKTIGADSLKLDRILGKTLVWNQMIRIYSCSSASSGVSGTLNADGTVTLNGTATASGYIACSFTPVNLTANHKVLFLAIGTPSAQIPSSNTGAFITSGDGAIITISRTGDESQVWLRFKSGDSFSNKKVYVQLIDLTLMFGETVASTMTVEKFEALYRPKYYSYNLGQLINNSAEGLETVGFNLWDEEWINGYVGNNGELIYGSGHAITNLIPVIGGNSYYWNEGYHPTNGYIVGYDSSLNYLGLLATIATSASFTMPQNCSYVRIQYNGSFNTVINYKFNFNLSDPNRNGQYEPHKRNVLDLHLENLQVKSPNIWDEEWVNGYWSNVVGNAPILDNAATNYLSSKNPIPVKSNTLYHFTKPSVTCRVVYLGSDGKIVAVSGDTNLSEFTTPANCVSVLFSLWSTPTYANNICINISDPGFNGKYFPHGVLTFNGLKQAGDVYDEIVNNGAIEVRKIHNVFLKDLTWTNYQTGRYRALLPASNKKTSADVVPNALCDRFTVKSGNGATGQVGEMWFSTSDNYVYIGANAAPTEGELNYELATYETYELVSPIPTAMPAGTTERRLPEDTSDSVLAPFACDMTYGTNPGDILASGIAWEKIWGRPTIVHDKSNVSLTTLDRHVIKIGDKELYLIFSVGSDGTSYTLRVATGLNNGVYENEQVFNFATIDDTTINNICHL